MYTFVSWYVLRFTHRIFHRKRILVVGAIYQSDGYYVLEADEELCFMLGWRLSRVQAWAERMGAVMTSPEHYMDPAMPFVREIPETYLDAIDEKHRAVYRKMKGL